MKKWKSYEKSLSCRESSKGTNTTYRLGIFPELIVQIETDVLTDAASLSEECGWFLLAERQVKEQVNFTFFLKSVI